MKYISALLVGGFAWTALSLAQAAEPEKHTAADLLDQAIWWPGDFGQVCKGDSNLGPTDAPNLQAYGTITALEYSLSEKRVEQLRPWRSGIAAELVARLKAFDWKNFPEAPKPPPGIVDLSKAELSTIGAGKAGPGPWQPQNSKALGAIMLRVIEVLEVVETLPELLRLEDELNTLNEAAVNISWSAGRGFWNQPFPAVLPDLYVPPVEIGGVADGSYSTRRSKSPEIEALYEPGKPGAAIRDRWLRWEGKVFHNLIFQREMLGVSLGLLEKKGYEPLRHSLIGRLTALGRRREGLALMAHGGIRSEADLPATQRRNGLIRDADLGVPRYERDSTSVPWSKSVREEARRLMQGFIKSEPIAGITDGAALLEESIASPGGWSQMCSLPPPIPSGVPMPAGTTLAHRHFNLGDETITRLQACRDLVIPVLLERMRGIILESRSDKGAGVEESFSSGRSGQSSRSFGPVLLQVVACLNAGECLPDLLRIEQQLSGIIVRAQSYAVAAVPELLIDSPVWDLAAGDDKSPAAALKNKRATGLLVCKIYQRELLGLVKTLLEREDYPPMKASAFVKAQRAEGRKQLLQEASNIKSEDDIPYNLRKQITWDTGSKRARVEDGAVMPVQLPYNDAIREEIRGLADRFCKEVPPEKRKAGDGMILSWLENE